MKWPSSSPRHRDGDTRHQTLAHPLPWQVAQGRGGSPPIVAIHASDEHVVLALRGELDLALSWELDICLAVAMEGWRRVVLDLRDLGFIDEVALEVIAEARRRFRRAGGELVARSAPPGVRTLLDLSGLADCLERDSPGAAAEPDPLVSTTKEL